MRELPDLQRIPKPPPPILPSTGGKARQSDPFPRPTIDALSSTIVNLTGSQPVPDVMTDQPNQPDSVFTVIRPHYQPLRSIPPKPQPYPIQPDTTPPQLMSTQPKPETDPIMVENQPPDPGYSGYNPKKASGFSSNPIKGSKFNPLGKRYKDENTSQMSGYFASVAAAVTGNYTKLQAPIIPSGERSSPSDQTKRRPFEFISNIFKKRKDEDHHDCGGTKGSQEEQSGLLSTPPSSSQAVDLLSSSPSLLTSENNWEELEQIRLSRQDNPYLQRVGGSEASLSDDDDIIPCKGLEQEDTTKLVTGVEDKQEALSLSEVHEHLIRSPPPTTIPKGVSPGVFVFPASETDVADKNFLNGNRAHSLNPLVTKVHDDVLDMHLRQILDTQKHLVVHRGDSVCSGSSSVPGSPARSIGVVSRTNKSPNPRQMGRDEASTVRLVSGANINNNLNASLGNFLSDSNQFGGVNLEVFSSSQNFYNSSVRSKQGNPSSSCKSSVSLAPVLGPGRKSSINSKLSVNESSFGSSLKPLTSKFRRSKSQCRPEISTISAAMVGSSSALTLPIRYPNSPASVSASLREPKGRTPTQSPSPVDRQLLSPSVGSRTASPSKRFATSPVRVKN